MNPDVPQRSGAASDRAIYVLRCIEKERDELEHRIKHSAPNDAIRITGPSLLARYKDKVAQAQKSVEGLR